MKKKILIAVAAVTALTCVTAFAQQPGRSGKNGDGKNEPRKEEARKDWQEKMKVEKIAFLTDCMELTSEEAQAFWPVYNKAEKEKGEAFKGCMDSYKALKEAIDSGKGDAEVKKLLSAYLEARQKADAIDRAYADQYLKVLPAAKAAKLFLGEEQFRKNQIHRLGGGGPRGGNEGFKAPGAPKAPKATKAPKAPKAPRTTEPAE